MTYKNLEGDHVKEFQPCQYKTQTADFLSKYRV